MIRHSQPSGPNGPSDPNDWDFDKVTLMLAGLLSVIILTAVGYGIFNSSQTMRNIPAMTEAPRPPSSVPRTNAAAPERTTSGAGDASTRGAPP